MHVDPTVLIAFAAVHSEMKEQYHAGGQTRIRQAAMLTENIQLQGWSPASAQHGSLRLFPLCAKGTVLAMSNQGVLPEMAFAC